MIIEPPELGALLSASAHPPLLLTFYKSKDGYFELMAERLRHCHDFKMLTWGSAEAFAKGQVAPR